MDNGPGVSLFQSTEVLQLNTSAQREEEEEALEDEKRRNEELQNLLSNAFDDLTDDDDGHSTLNSSHCDASTNGEGLLLGDLDNHNYSDNMTYNGQRPLQKLTKGTVKFGDNSCNLFPDKFIKNDSNKENAWQQNTAGKNNKVDIMNGTREAAYQHQYYDNIDTFSKLDVQEAYRQAEYNSIDQLQVLYEVRLREIKRLTEQIEVEQKDAAEYKDQMFRKLALSEAEKERAIISRTQANELLVKSKEEIGELQKEVATLKQNVSSLEKTKSEQSKELNMSRAMINELQQKLIMIERCDVQKNLEKEMDSVIKELKNKHQQEISNLQQQVDFTTAKYNQKEKECSSLDQKVSEMQRAQEALLVEKSDTINQLARSLEESQAQCRQLMGSNVSCDNIRLQTLLDEALHEKKELQRMLNSIQTECDMLKSDVAQYESITKLSLPGDSSSDETDSIVNLGISQKSTSRRSSNVNFSDLGSKLKNELHRAVLNQKAKRMEIYKLQETLNTKEKQIQEMSKKERIYLTQTEALKEDMAKLMDQLKAQREKDNRKENITEIISKEEIDRLNERIVQLQKEKLELEKDKQELEAKNKLLQDKLEELSDRIDEEKRNVLEEYNKQYMQFHDETVSKLRKEMDESSEVRVNECRLKLEQTVKELDEVKRLYIEVSKAKDQLSQELKCEREAHDKVVMEKEAALTKMMTIRDQLTKKCQTSKQENDELNSKLKRFEEELTKNDSAQTVVKLKKETDDLRKEISRMSNLHADELSIVRTELQAARERLIKLEKNLRSQLETEMTNVRSEKEELRMQFEEKENNLKRIIEAQKRRPVLRDIGTETVDTGEAIVNNNIEKESCDCEGRMEEMKEKHEKELALCKSQLDSLVKNHQEELKKASVKSEEDVNSVQESYRQLLETIQKRIIEEENNMKLKHASELALVEEKTKDMAVKFFTEEFRKMETKYQQELDEAKKRPDPSVVENLKKALLGKTEEVNILKEGLSKTFSEYEKKVAALQKQIEEDREKMSDVMAHWAQEVKIMKVQMTAKDNTIDELKVKLKSLRTVAKKYHNQLTGSRNNLIATQSRMEAILTEKEKEVDIRIEEIERQYETKEKELRNKIYRRPRT